MYAIISCGGKQYAVSENDEIDVEYMNVKENETVTFEPLLISDKAGQSTIGTPTVSGATVVASVIEHGKGEKLNIARYKKMNGHHRAQGHRQPYTRLKIVSIKN